ncbi:hypothetical protein [Magnetospirillum sp. 64-120]|uniref:hypothetical protein n=1 Tax=Magnetospirillum sp. 64-120 TaxID=1895778 RepID=UPI00092A0DE0|nr:hypothetical protein [Magnetospirillum sp. 64-120]OJX78546.1 MAG: hypothetical protein BGO92_01450 [Magnetospirillum sp. 64-120]
MTKVSQNNTATALPAEASRNPDRFALAEGATAADVENALLDLKSVSCILLDMAVSLKDGHDLSWRSLNFLSTTISDRAHTLNDDLGLQVFPLAGEG